MKCFRLAAVLVILCQCGCAVRSLERPHRPLGQAETLLTIMEGNIGEVETNQFRWVAFPYTVPRMRCFGGKANYNAELAKSESGIICPFGPVSRGMSVDLHRYSIRVRILTRDHRRRVVYCREGMSTKVSYDECDTKKIILLLTIENLSEDDENLRVEQIDPSSGRGVLDRVLAENECFVVFSGKDIFIKSSGDVQIRGYRDCGK